MISFNVFTKTPTSSVQFSDSVVSNSWKPMDRSMPGLPVHHQLLEFTQTHVHWVSDAIQPSHPLLPPSLLLAIFPHIRVFSSKSALHIRWPKYWSFSFSISPSNEYSGLISFKIDWLDLLAVQGTLQESSPTQQFKSISCLALSLPLPPLCTYPLCIPISSSVQHWSFLPLTRPDPLPFQEATLSFFFCIVSISF